MGLRSAGIAGKVSQVAAGSGTLLQLVCRKHEPQAALVGKVQILRNPPPV